MSNLEERLEQASAEVRRHLQQASRPPIPAGRIQRRRIAAAIAVGVIAVAAVATPLVFLGTREPSDSASTTVVGPMPESEPDLILYLSPESEGALGRAAAEARTWEGVTYAAPFDREMILAEFQKMFAAQPELVALVEEDPTVLPTSIRLWLDRPTEAQAIAESATRRLAAIGVVVAQNSILGEGTRVPLVTTTMIPAPTDTTATTASTTTLPGAVCGAPAPDEPRLGLGYVWPEQPRAGTPTDLATAFTVEVLGWTDATVTPDPEGDDSGPVLVHIQQPGFAALDVFTSPSGDGGRVIFQVGSPSAYGALEPIEDSPGAWLGLHAPAGAVLADVAVRATGDPDGGTSVFLASGADLAAGRIEIARLPSEPETILRAQDIGSSLIRYWNSNGCVVAAAGGHG
jgi:hypothetical protein